MTEKELRRLSRTELLEMLLKQSKETERLQDELKQAKTKWKSREIMIQDAGSIAEASLRINGVFEAAQRAADQYIENIRRQSTGAEAKCQAMEEETRVKCEQMIQQAERQSASYWQETRDKLEQFIAQQESLRESLTGLFHETERQG